MSDLIDRQQAIDDIWTVSPLAPLDREWVDRWLRQLPPANNSEIPNSSDMISRQAVKDILDKYQLRYHIYPYVWDAINELPPAQPEPYTDALKAEIRRMKMSFTICINSDYYTGYMSALSAVERYIAQMEETDGNNN